MTNRLAPAAVLLLLAACSPGASRAPASAPAPVAAAPAVAPDTVDSGPELETAELKDASSALLGSVRYDMPMEANTWVAAELEFLVNQRKAVVGRWLERAEPYQEFVKGVFAGYGLPTDMHHLAMVESGFIPTARSHAGAVGLWQFMPATGRGMGLRIDDLVDERMDPVRSTHAAAKHLRDLHRTFGGDWSLAAAAYNAGTGRISRGMQGIGAKNFWELAVWGTLAQETRQYVPRLYAVTIIARDRERFGFARPGGLVRPFAYDSIRTDLSIPLAELAMMANLPATEIARLNPHLHRGMTPAGAYWVWVPRGAGAALQAAYDNSEIRRDGGYGSYAVRRGDSAEKLALVAGMTISRIRELNPSADLEKLSSGTRLRLPRAAAAALAARPVERVASRDSDEGRGERARREGGEERGKGDRGSEPRRSERSSASRDRDGDSERPSTRSRRESASSERESSSSSSSRKSGEGSSSSASERRREGRATEHKVEDGETLWGLSRRFDVSVEEIREANDLKGDVIVPGRTLRIPRKTAVSEERSERSSSERSSSAARSSSERSSSSSSSARTARRSEESSSSTRKDGDSRKTERESVSSSSGSSSSRTARSSSEKSETRSSEARSSESRSSGTRSAAREHVVKNGETLWAIARMYDSTVVAIQRANEMEDDSPIRPGQKLRIPSGASRGK
jgi:membrane-bound lytic murein transglycosylase D